MKKQIDLLNLAAIVILLTICSCARTHVSPEERKKMEILLNETYSDLGKVYTDCEQYVQDIRTGKIKIELGCDAGKDAKADPKSIDMFNVLELKKFTAKTNKEFQELQKEWHESEWHWMSTSRYSLDDYMNSMPENMSDRKLDEASYTVTNASWGSMFFDKEFAVILPDPLDTISMGMPEILDDEKSISGYFNGWVLVVSRDNYEIVCASPIRVISSDKIEYTEFRGRRGGLLNNFTKSRKEKLILDYKERFKKSLKITLEGYKTGYFGGF